MLFRQLEYFVALARERHFAQAARACYVSQSSLSEAIRKLEHELKVPLVRRGRAFEGLTPEGERLVFWARRILADHDALKQEVTALQQGVTGELRLGVIPAASGTVALLTDPLCNEHPLLRVRLETNLRSADILERIRRFDLDGGLVYPEGLDTIDLRVTPLYYEEPILVAGRELVAGRSRTIGWSEALELPLCLLDKGMRGRRLIDEALAAQGLLAAPQLESDSLTSLLAHAATGRWACVIPHPLLGTLSSPAGTRVLRLADPAITAQIALITGAEQPDTVLTRALTETARDRNIQAALSRMVAAHQQ